MRYILAAGLLAASVSAASAQHAFTPISGPNDAIASPVCDLINFGFCPQPAPPPPPLPDPNAVVDAPPPASVAPHHRRPHRHHAATR